MAVFIILTDVEAGAVLDLDDNANAAVAPRLIDGTDAPFELQGKQVLPVEIIDDPDYQKHCMPLVRYLVKLPQMDLDPEIIFAPAEDFD